MNKQKIGTWQNRVGNKISKRCTCRLIKGMRERGFHRLGKGRDITNLLIRMGDISLGKWRETAG